jgi:GT2 family glycosyltransferase
MSTLEGNVIRRLPAEVLTVVTVTYNSAREIRDFVDSVDKQGVYTRLWLIDNASSDGTAGLLQRLAGEHEWISVILNERNLGLAAANNQPLESLSSQFTAIINPDVVLHAGALRALVSYLQGHPDVVAVAPVNVDDDGTPHSSFHRGWSLIHLLVWRLLPSPVTRRLYEAFRAYGEQDVLFASGACLVMRTDDFKGIGGYDPEYFLTVEDVCDLCIRLRRGDPRKRVVVTPSANITHLRSRSAVVVPFISQWNAARGSIYHFHKHGGLAAGVAAYCIIFGSILVRILATLPLAVFSKRRRASLSNNGRVLRQLLRDNPLSIKRTAGI